VKLLLKRARWWNGDAEGHGDIRTAGGVIAEIGRGLAAKRRERTVDADGLLVLPGLINCHDHLGLNLLPHLGTPPYMDFYAWAEEIYRPDEQPIRDVLRVGLRDRLRWGGYRNLMAGVTTVAHHDPYHRLWFGARFPVQVLKQYGWSHSLGFATDPARDYRHSRGPYLIHAAEGLNGRSSSEVDELVRLGLLGPRTVIVHAVAVSERQQSCLEAADCSVVWCPSSNFRLYGRTAPIDRYLGRLRIGLGTDSTISGTPHLLDELRVAHQSGLASPMDVLRMVTTTAAEILGLGGGQGRVEPGGCADVMAVPDAPGTPGDALLAATPADVALVLVGGEPRLAGEAQASQLGLGSPNARTAGRPTWMAGDIAALRRRIRLSAGAAPLEANPLWSMLTGSDGL
jgi:cytosine/adenosine deaminase-related metal-dependent hydrolase